VSLPCDEVPGKETAALRPSVRFGSVRPENMVSDLGIPHQRCFTDEMEKSIHSPAQAALNQVLRQLRGGAGLRQEDMARLLDEPQSFVSKYESGERRLDLLELRAICAAAGVSLHDLVDRFEESLRSCNLASPSSDFQSRSGRTSEPSVNE
ncbi:MAG: helix-turn-helix domain-containing protein, partial [Planctomycetia bacterium]